MIEKHQTGSLAILGDSAPTADLIPSQIGPGVVNLALGGATPIEVYYMAQRLLEGPAPPKAVILSLAPIHFVSAQYYWPYTVGFHFLSPHEAEEVRRRSRAIGDDSIMGAETPGDTDVRLRFLFYHISFPSCYFPDLIGSHICGRTDFNLKELQAVVANRGQHYFGLGTGTGLLDTNALIEEFYPLKILDDYFDRTLALFQAHHVPVYFIAMPLNGSSESLFRPAVLDDYVHYLAGYEHRYPGFRVLGHPPTFWPATYFGDAWHLNTTGAPLWSAEVRKMLNDAHVPGGPFVAGMIQPSL
jgi:hypothetical protein